MKQLSKIETQVKNYREGRVMPPILLYFLGVPLGLCLVLWLLFFRG